jgi:Leucine-rich repeat (LRR) protein
MVNAQEWFDRKYPKNIRNIITEIKIDAFELHKKEKLKKEEYLESSLKIENFPNLKNFDCCNNKITELEFINCSELEKIRCCNNRLDLLNIKNLPNLKKLNCSDNFLTTIDLSSNIKLEELDLGDNGFEKQNLFFLSHLINLENLDLGNRDRGSYMHFYNQFYGSLKPLQNLNKLQKLDISNTDIDRGLKYLPVSVNFFNCRAEVE